MGWPKSLGLLAGAVFFMSALIPNDSSARAAQAAGDDADSGLVWKSQGAWTVGGRLVEPFRSVRLAALECNGTGEIYLLTNIRGVRLTCVNKEKKSTLFSLGPLQFTTVLFAKLLSQDGATYHSAMSRAAGWSDAVIGVDSVSADFEPVFRRARPRKIEFRICPLEGDGCTSVLQTEWDGKAALVSEVRQLKMGVFRLVSSDGANEAWVRIVPKDRAASIQTEYADAISVLRSWSLPPEAADPAGLDRLERMILGSVGTAESR